MATKKFKPHMMYPKKGKGVMANTYKKHLELKKKGYGHTKPKIHRLEIRPTRLRHAFLISTKPLPNQSNDLCQFF